MGCSAVVEANSRSLTQVTETHKAPSQRSDSGQERLTLQALSPLDLKALLPATTFEEVCYSYRKLRSRNSMWPTLRGRRHQASGETLQPVSGNRKNSSTHIKLPTPEVANCWPTAANNAPQQENTIKITTRTRAECRSGCFGRWRRAASATLLLGLLRDLRRLRWREEKTPYSKGRRTFEAPRKGAVAFCQV